MRKFYVDNMLKPQVNDVIFDIGCGPADILEFLPEVQYFGVDHNPRYIEQARKRWPQALFETTAVLELNSGYLPPADLVMANAVLHHLDDTEATHLFATAARLLREGGRLCTLDNHFYYDQHPLSRWLIERDRGRFVRNADGYAALAAPFFQEVRRVTRPDLLHVPYDIVMFEFVLRQKDGTSNA